MAKLPNFPFYVDDWLSSAKVQSELDDAERGIYIQLLALAWNIPQNLLPLDVERCRKMCRAKRAIKVEKVLIMFFVKTDQGWYNNRQRKERALAEDRHLKQVLAGKASANKRIHSTDVERPFVSSLPPATPPKPEPPAEKQKPERSPKFKKPTIAEIAAYCEERGNGIDAEYFYNKHEATGWVYGKNKTPIISWKAVIHTWERFNATKTPQPKAEAHQSSGREGFA